jgi:hypothetical protein
MFSFAESYQMLPLQDRLDVKFLVLTVQGGRIVLAAASAPLADCHFRILGF